MSWSALDAWTFFLERARARNTHVEATSHHPGGNAFATMLATVSPSEDHYEETLATLKYAARARKVRSKASVNAVEDLPSESDVESSVAATPPLLAAPLARKGAAEDPEDSVLSTSTGAPRWPRLTNLNPDPAFAGRGSLGVHEGATVLGSSTEAGVALLAGSGVRPRHAVVCSSAANDVVVLCALPGAETHVNGRLVLAEPAEGDASVAVATVLKHGSRVVFARTLAFRFEAYPDDDLARRDATAEWHAAQDEVTQASSRAPSPPPWRSPSPPAWRERPPAPPSDDSSDSEDMEPLSPPPPERPPLDLAPRPRFEPVFEPALQVFGRPDDHLASMKRKVELAQAQLDAILGTAPPPSKAATLAGDAVLGQPLRAAGAATAAAAGLANTLATGVAGALPTY